MTKRDAPLLSVRDLRVTFQRNGLIGAAVDGVSFDLERGEVLGLVGESGSGKSMTALSIVNLLPPTTCQVTGTIEFDGKDILSMSQTEIRPYRWRRIAMVLQDPLAVLNPVFTIGQQLAEPLRVHLGLRGVELRERCLELLRSMRIPEPVDKLQAYPHQLSGGMRQRVVGAIALSGNPDLLIADEPTTALDATTQAAYLDVLRSIQRRSELAILFITHDLGVAETLCDRTAVMYGGTVVEIGPTRDLFDRPAHPYTRALLNAVPRLLPSEERLTSIAGSPPSIFESREGCRFRDRCPLYAHLSRPERCRTDTPALHEIDFPAHASACHFADELSRQNQAIG